MLPIRRKFSVNTLNDYLAKFINAEWTGEDLDRMTSTGTYVFSTPANAPFNYGLLLVWTTTPGWLFQLAIGLNKEVAYRVYDASWCTWRYFTMA